MLSYIYKFVKGLFTKDKNIRIIKKIDYEKITRELERGDVIIVKGKGFLSKTKYKYSGIYVGGSFNSLYAYGVINVINKGVVINELHSLLLKAESITIKRPSSGVYIKRDRDLVCKRAKNTINQISSYDWKIPSNGKVTVEELIRFSYRRLSKRDIVEFNYRGGVKDFTDNKSFTTVNYFTL
jgi:hypothetical protein